MDPGSLDPELRRRIESLLASRVSERAGVDASGLDRRLLAALARCYLELEERRELAEEIYGELRRAGIERRRAVELVALYLGYSESTVYRYLRRMGAL